MKTPKKQTSENFIKEILDIKVKNYSKLLNSQKEYLEKENIKKADLNALELCQNDYDAFSCNKKIVKNLNKLYDKERIKLCPDLNEIKKFDAFFDKQLKKYELIICFPPLVKNYEAYINSAFKLLNDKGKILFLAPISILNNKKFRGYLNEHDSSISGIFELDNKLQTENVMGFTNINVSLIILNKNIIIQSFQK
jgi:hypothetical protein